MMNFVTIVYVKNRPNIFNQMKYIFNIYFFIFFKNIYNFSSLLDSLYFLKNTSSPFYFKNLKNYEIHRFFITFNIQIQKNGFLYKIFVLYFYLFSRILIYH
ncbi:hypothetical protein EDEG_00245 [Edhazardia aedis USNM 41457]|uniref:Uncharacterized protein n=1 Tax=Edhazardia aedis (strain USNM 41457) TaxID=1003232 RepID=J9D6F9_EDHAE|nr:hypothetical protein EDEG_00245 [Edhazardia aedis USNM 41457]|eukprot:EJW03094.1 hypothetical protein EDEG_00245 [Edhazardia aedis USNM 41457]